VNLNVGLSQREGAITENASLADGIEEMVGSPQKKILFEDADIAGQMRMTAPDV